MSNRLIANLKITSAFASTQFVEVIFGLIRSKIASIFIGVLGIGLVGLFNAPLGIIIVVSSLGINYVFVKDLSILINNCDNELKRTLDNFKYFVVLTAVLGAFLTYILAPYIVNITFQDGKYLTDFRYLSLFIFFSILTNGNKSVNQAFRHVKKNILMSIWTTIISSISTILLYFFFRAEGILWSIIFSSVISFIISEIFVNSNHSISRFYLSTFHFRKFVAYVKEGTPMVLSNILTATGAYVVVLIITNLGGLKMIGFYTAGMAIVGQLSSTVFIAMGTDYFPRLSSQVKDNEKLSEEVNLQLKMSFIVIIPVIVFSILFSQLLIKLFYTEDFFAINQFIKVYSISLLFKAVSWSIGYILVAKGEGKKVLMSELIFTSLNIFFSYFGFTIFGLMGVAIANVILYIIHVIYMYIITRTYHDFKIDTITLRFLIIFLTSCSILLYVNIFTNVWMSYLLSVLIVGYIFYNLFLILSNKNANLI